MPQRVAQERPGGQGLRAGAARGGALRASRRGVGGAQHHCRRLRVGRGGIVAQVDKPTRSVDCRHCGPMAMCDVAGVVMVTSRRHMAGKGRSPQWGI